MTTHQRSPGAVSVLLPVAICSALLLGGCLAAPIVGEEQSPIVDGIAENGYPSVVFLISRSGGACSAGIVAPRVVLTARHCVENRGGGYARPEDLLVYVGPVAFRPERQYRVSEVHPVLGGGIRNGNDVALLTLASAAVETPLELSFEPPRVLGGEFITAVGYGQTPAGQSGRKYRTQKRVTAVSGGFIFVEPSVCQGDSGSPLIGPEGRVWGVASFIFDRESMSEPRCGVADGAYNAIIQHQEFIESVIVESGTCIPRDEVCNGVDDNCDGTVDEGCSPLGSPCSESGECVGGLCADTAAGRVCTQECDPLTPMLGCPPMMYCARAGGSCGGYCLSGGAGEGLIGANCTADTECISAFCADPGDGRQRCLAPCVGNRGMCLAGEVCAAGSEACNGCVSEEIVVGARGYGESCESDDDCADGTCLSDAGLSYCSRGCESDEVCGEGFHCRTDICIRGPRESIGGGCVANEDCDAGFVCASRGRTSWCTRACGEGCPNGFRCDEQSSVCEPALALVGEDCIDSSDCLSNLCAGTERGLVCTRYCGADRHCSPGLECVRLNQGLDGVCLSPPPQPEGGCSVQPGSTPLYGAWAVFGLLAGLLGWRRRR